MDRRDKREMIGKNGSHRTKLRQGPILRLRFRLRPDTLRRDFGGQAGQVSQE